MKKRLPTVMKIDIISNSYLDFDYDE